MMRQNGQRTNQHSPLPRQILLWTQNQPEAVITLEVGSIRVRCGEEPKLWVHLQSMTI